MGFRDGPGLERRDVLSISRPTLTGCGTGGSAGRSRCPRSLMCRKGSELDPRDLPKAGPVVGPLEDGEPQSDLVPVTLGGATPTGTRGYV